MTFAVLLAVTALFAALLRFLRVKPIVAVPAAALFAPICVLIRAYVFHSTPVESTYLGAAAAVGYLAGLVCSAVGYSIAALALDRAKSSGGA